MQHMGKAHTIMMRQHFREELMHQSVDAWYAPSECHASVRRGAEKRARIARRLAKSVSGLSRRQFNKELKKLTLRAKTKLYEIMWNDYEGWNY